MDFDKCVLYVPYGSEDAYSEAEGWKQFNLHRSGDLIDQDSLFAHGGVERRKDRGLQSIFIHSRRAVAVFRPIVQPADAAPDNPLFPIL